MKPRLKHLALALASLGLSTLVACGGGSSEPAAAVPPDAAAPQAGAGAPSPVVLTGTVATGAALSGATLKVHDATGAIVCEKSIGEDGAYACDLGTSPSAPFVVVAERDDATLVSVQAEARSGVVNVTPLTHLVAARLSTTGDPLKLVEEIRAAPERVAPAKVQAAVDGLVTALRPLLDAVGAFGDPIATPFAADGTGHDRLLDTIHVSVRPAGEQANVEITVKAPPVADDAEPVRLAFRTGDAAIAPLSAQAVAGVAPAGENVAALVADLTARLGTCYALPREQRVSAGGSAGSTIVAPACRSLFVGDDPASFLSNGARVGPAGAFRGMFSDGGTGVRFDRGNLEFRRVNGDYVVSYRWTARDGGTDNETIVARRENGVLKAIGNQYAYDARVRPIAQQRELLNSPAYSSIATGYNVWIANRVDDAGEPVFDRVVVTTPRGTRLTYRPNPGMSALSLVRADGKPPGSSVLWLAGRWLDPSTPGHPKDKEGSMNFADPAEHPDVAIRAIPDQSVWRMEFVHADPSVPDVVQAYRTVSRAATLDEVYMTSFAGPTELAKDALRARSAATGSIAWTTPAGGTVPNHVGLGVPGGGDFWTVPSGALAPTWVGVFGRAPTVGPEAGARFNDGMNVSTNARRATIRCSAQSADDLHCAEGHPDQYAQGSVLHAFEFWARSPRQLEVSKIVGVYRLQ